MTESQHREKRGAIEGPIRIPLHSLSFLFSALVFPSIPSNSLKFRPVVFSIPTAPTRIPMFDRFLGPTGTRSTERYLMVGKVPIQSGPSPRAGRSPEGAHIRALTLRVDRFASSELYNFYRRVCGIEKDLRVECAPRSILLYSFWLHIQVEAPSLTVHCRSRPSLP